MARLILTQAQEDALWKMLELFPYDNDEMMKRCAKDLIQIAHMLCLSRFEFAKLFDLEVKYDEIGDTYFEIMGERFSW